MGTGSGFGSADLILVAVGLEGVDAIGVAFRKGGRYVDCLAQDHGGVPLADALFEDAAALVRGDDVEECGHHVHGGTTILLPFARIRVIWLRWKACSCLRVTTHAS